MRAGRHDSCHRLDCGQAAMARGRGLLKQAQQGRLEERDAPQCPLCIEALDSHEQGWYPCPCGYQVCAFCYQRLQLENKKQCPGCRMVYGFVLEEAEETDKPTNRRHSNDESDSQPQVSASQSSELESGRDGSSRTGSLDLSRKTEPIAKSHDGVNGRLGAELSSSALSNRPQAWKGKLDQEAPASTSYSSAVDNGIGNGDSQRVRVDFADLSLRQSAQPSTSASGAQQPGDSAHARVDLPPAIQALADLPVQDDSAPSSFQAPERLGPNSLEGQAGLWEKLLAVPRPQLHEEASSMRQSISNNSPYSTDPRSAEPGALFPGSRPDSNGEIASPRLPSLGSGQASVPISVPFHVPLQQTPRGPDPSGVQALPPRLVESSGDPVVGAPRAQPKAIADEGALGARHTDMEVPAPRKRTTGEEKLRSWLTEGVKVAPPVRNYQGLQNGFSNASNPAVPAPSREARCSAHGAVGDSINPSPGVNQPPSQYNAFGLTPGGSGGDNLWGPLSKQSSGSSFWGGPPQDSDPVPESVSELWADKSRAQSRFNFRPGSHDGDRESQETPSLARDSTLASSIGRPINGLISHNSLASNFPGSNGVQFLGQEQNSGSGNVFGHQAQMPVASSNNGPLGFSGLLNTGQQSQAPANHLQGMVSRASTPNQHQSISPPFGRGFGQTGLAASQGYPQAFPSPLSIKGPTPPGLGGRVGPNFGNPVGHPVGPSGLNPLGAAGLANHLPRSTGLPAHLNGTGLFNTPSSQPTTPRLQNQLGQSMPGLQRPGNGMTGYGADQRNALNGPPGLGLGPSSTGLNLGNNGVQDYSQLKQYNQRQLLQELQNQQLLRQQASTGQYGQQQFNSQNAQAQLLLERREQLRQLMQQGVLDINPQQLQQLQAQQLLMNQQQKAVPQQNLWSNTGGSPGPNFNGMLNNGVGHRLFQR